MAKSIEKKEFNPENVCWDCIFITDKAGWESDMMAMARTLTMILHRICLTFPHEYISQVEFYTMAKFHHPNFESPTRLIIGWIYIPKGHPRPDFDKLFEVSLKGMGA